MCKAMEPTDGRGALITIPIRVVIVICISIGGSDINSYIVASTIISCSGPSSPIVNFSFFGRDGIR